MPFKYWKPRSVFTSDFDVMRDMKTWSKIYSNVAIMITMRIKWGYPRHRQSNCWQTASFRPPAAGGGIRINRCD